MAPRSFFYAAVACLVCLSAFPQRAAAQYYYPPPPPGYPPPPPIGEAPMGPEYRTHHFRGHPMFTLELLPLTDFGYDLGPGPETDLGYGASLSLGYMTLWGLGLEAKVGVRRHSSYEVYDAAGDVFTFSQTMVPVTAGFRYDFSHIWGGGAADPFISAHFGSGGYYYKDNVGGNLNWWTFVFDVGAGVDLWVGDFVGVGLAYWFEYYNNIDDVSINALALEFTL